MFYLSFKVKFEYLVSLFNIKLKCLISFFEIKFECLVSPWERLCFCWTLSLSLLSTCGLHCGLGKHLIHIFEESTFWDFVRVCTLALSMRSLHCDLEKEMIYTNLRKHHQLPSHPSSLHWELNIEYCISYWILNIEYWELNIEYCISYRILNIEYWILRTEYWKLYLISIRAHFGHHIFHIQMRLQENVSINLSSYFVLSFE